MNISLKKRTFLILLAGLTATFASAQEQPLPEWQSQYAVGLNKLAQKIYRKKGASVCAGGIKYRHSGMHGHRGSA